MFQDRREVGWRRIYLYPTYNLDYIGHRLGSLFLCKTRLRNLELILMRSSCPHMMLEYRKQGRVRVLVLVLVLVRAGECMQTSRAPFHRTCTPAHSPVSPGSLAQSPPGEIAGQVLLATQGSPAAGGPLGPGGVGEEDGMHL